jgi:hypothetical protein
VEEWTVKQLRAELPAEPRPGGLSMMKEWNAILGWLDARRESWPAENRPEFGAFVSRILGRLELPDVDADEGLGLATPGEAAA